MNTFGKMMVSVNDYVLDLFGNDHGAAIFAAFGIVFVLAFITTAIGDINDIPSVFALGIAMMVPIGITIVVGVVSFVIGILIKGLVSFVTSNRYSFDVWKFLFNADNGADLDKPLFGLASTMYLSTLVVSLTIWMSPWTLIPLAVIVLGLLVARKAFNTWYILNERMKDVEKE